jgi:hypothetical protein
MERSIDRVIAALEARSVGREIVAMENEVKCVIADTYEVIICSVQVC